MENKEDKLIKVTARIPQSQKDMIVKVVEKSCYESVSDFIRAGIDKELSLQIYKDNLDDILKELDKMLEAKLKPFIDSQRKLNAKYLRTTAINTYLLGEVLDRLLGDDMHKQFIGMLTNARKKANYYINHDASDMTKKDLYDYYTIGEMYRNE